MIERLAPVIFCLAYEVPMKLLANRIETGKY